MKTQPSSLPAFSGIIGACLTPFHEDGRINYEALKKEIDFIIEDADAISIAAVEAAEYTMLSVQERKELMKTAAEMVEKRIPVILGASHPSPGRAIKLAEFCADMGADMVQVLMPLRPWGGQPTMQELIDYFTEIAMASPVHSTVDSPSRIHGRPPASFIARGRLSAISTYVQERGGASNRE